MEEEQKIITHSDEYQALVEECQSIITERVWNFRMEKILMYGQLGERIITDLLYKKYSKGNVEFLEAIAKDVGIQYSEITRAIQFYEKFEVVAPDSEGWSKLKEGKNISWSKIKDLYLPEGDKKECKHDFKEIKRWQCRLCKKISDVNPNAK